MNAPALQVILTDAQLDDLAERIARKLAEAPVPTYDQDHLPPYLTKRRFLEAARAGSFPAKKVGRTVIATRADVDRWVAAQPSAKSPPKDAPANDTTTEEEALALRDAARNGSKVLVPARRV